MRIDTKTAVSAVALLKERDRLREIVFDDRFSTMSITVGDVTFDVNQDAVESLVDRRIEVIERTLKEMGFDA